MDFKNIILKILDKFIKGKNKVIHAEALVRDDEWEELKKLIGKGYIWFIITPANYDYCKSIFNIKMEKNEFSTILRKRLEYLKENNEEIQLSIHLNKVKKFLENKLQEDRFNEAMNFMTSLDIKPKKLVAVDGVYNKYTLTLAKKHGIVEIYDFNLYIIAPLLKIINWLGIKISFINEIYHNLKKRDFKSVFHLLLGEFLEVKEKTIHIESFMRNDVWEALKNKAIEKGYIWFVITPANYNYCKSYFNLKMDKDEFSNILRNRINYLKNQNEEIQLHLHLNINRKFLDNKIQENKFKEAMEFMTSCGIKPKKFVAGWWIYNRYTILIAKKYGFEEIYDYTINPLQKMINFNGMKIKFVHKYWHDFELI